MADSDLTPNPYRYVYCVADVAYYTAEFHTDKKISEMCRSASAAHVVGNYFRHIEELVDGEWVTV